jgi:hypothetical protein
LEDKIVQHATVAVLNAIYEEDFLGFSYGFRPKRSQHDALDALAVGITRTMVNYIVDADIARFFDTVSHGWLIRFLNHRIGDRRIIRLIQKWFKAGVLEDGVWQRNRRLLLVRKPAVIVERTHQAIEQSRRSGIEKRASRRNCPMTLSSVISELTPSAPSQSRRHRAL